MAEVVVVISVVVAFATIVVVVIIAALFIDSSVGKNGHPILNLVDEVFECEASSGLTHAFLVLRPKFCCVVI